MKSFVAILCFSRSRLFTCLLLPYAQATGYLIHTYFPLTAPQVLRVQCPSPGRGSSLRAVVSTVEGGCAMCSVGGVWGELV